MSTKVGYYPDFEYPANSILKYIRALEFFTIMLQNKEIVHFTPADPASFEQWLKRNEIPDIRKDM